MLYELRTYEATPGNVENVHKRFGDHTVGFFKKYGIGMFGFWEEEVSPAHLVLGHGGSMTYMLSFEDAADREKKWAAFRADPEWTKVRAGERGQRAHSRAGPQHPHVDHSVLPRAQVHHPGPRASLLRGLARTDGGLGTAGSSTTPTVSSRTTG